jgi:hypothetical protein
VVPQHLGSQVGALNFEAAASADNWPLSHRVPEAADAEAATALSSLEEARRNRLLRLERLNRLLTLKSRALQPDGRRRYELH